LSELQNFFLPWANVINLITPVIYEILQARVFVPVKPFQLNVM